VARLNKLSDQNLDALRDPSVGPLLTAFSPPAPTALTAVGGDGVATLSWVPSSTLSQLPITDHEIQVSADGTSWTTFSDGVSTSPSAVVTGLNSGSSYFFRVRSKNTAGVGAYATTPSAVSIGLPPSAPTGLAATAGERRVSLSWSVPSSNGGVAISDYQIEYSVDSGSTWTAVTRSASTATSFTVTGLLGQVPYQFRVRAVNGIAAGAWSTVATATPVSYDEYWDDVSLLLKMEGDGASLVDSSPNNTAITSIGVSQSTVQKKWGTKSADFGVSGNYLSVAAGPSTAIPGSFTIEMWVYWKTAPTSEVTFFHGANNRTEGRGMAFLTNSSTGQGLRYGRAWIAELFPAVATQFKAGQWYHIAVVREADFRIRLFVDGVQLNQNTPLDVWSGSAALSGRMFVGYPGRPSNLFIDEFRVTKRARYSANFTPPSEPFPTGKRPAAPAAPATVTATIGDGQLTASWTAVAGAASYVVEYQLSGGAWEAAGTTSSTSLQITGLANGQTYTVRVAAVSVGGQGVWATSAAVTLLTPPAQVTGLVASAGHLQACLSWTAPDGDIADYTVQYSDGSGWQTFAHPQSTNTFITVTGLTNGVSYQFRVAATNALTTGTYSTLATATPSLSLPEAPTAVTGASGSGLVSLAWTAPANTSCRLLTNYIISYSSDSGSLWTNLTPQPATSATATISGLSNGVAYIFRVAYQSAAGTGPWSEASASITPSGPPNPPVSVSGTAGDGQVAVSWIPGSDGGSLVTDYLLQYSANQTAWTQIDDGQSTSTSYTVTGLTNGTAYYFRVSARTAVGDSVPTQSAAITPRGVPGAPGTPSGTAGSGQVALTWSAAAANGSPVTGYTVEYTPAGGSPQTVATNSATASYTVTGLTNGTSYTFRVQAANVVGAGAFSAASSSIVPVAVPAAPTSLAGTAGNGGVDLSWVAPSDTGGAAITNYTVEYTPAGGSALTATASASPYTLSGLTNGTAYSIRVAANNSVGRGAYASAITRTPVTTPGTPTGVTATGGSASGRLALSWTAPASNGGSAITSYTVEYTPSGGSAQTVSTASAANSYDLDGLTNGTLYSVRVRAVNAVGAGSYSVAASGTPGSVPGTPTAFAGTIGNASVALSWTAPASNGGVAITNYTVEYTPAGGSAATATASSSPYTLTGLTNGTSYSIRVAANNAIGRGAYTSAISRTPATTPGTPTSVTATPGNGSVSLAWTAPAMNGGTFVRYRVRRDGVEAATPTSTSATITGLTNGTSYSFDVAAENAVGIGPYSSPVNATPDTPPAAPTALDGSASSARIALTWTAPSPNGGTTLTGYMVEFTPAGGSAQTVSTGGTGTSYTLTGLTNGTAYTVRVAGVNAAGVGAYTATITRTPSFTAMAVLLTSGTSYTVPAGATSMKAWAVGAGGNARNSGYGSAGGVAYKTWSVTSGGSVAYALGFGHATDNWNDPRQDTTVTYNGTTITGGTAGPQPNIAGGFSGGDGGANGGVGGTGASNNYYSGAVGGNGPSVNYSPNSGCGTMTALDVSGLFAAVTLAGENASSPCATPAAFGTGGAYLRSPGYGGGGGSGTLEAQPGGPAAVVLYFT
jgi:titin